jgi:RNA polymerase sigma factor (sigma-70 family)
MARAGGGGGDDSHFRRAPADPGFEDAYRKHADLLRHIAETKFNIPPSDAESVVNEVFTAYLLRRETVRNERKWLIGAACHASRAYWREVAKTTPLPENVSEYLDPSSPGLERRIVDNVTMARALMDISPKCRETLRLYYAEGYSAAEIATRFGTTSNYVMQLLHICRKHARKAYDALKDNRKG